MSVALREATADDVRAIVAIERESFSDPWTTLAFAQHVRAHGSTFLVALEPAADVAGYAIGRWVADEAELLTIAVARARRGSGVASRLLDAVIARCAREGAVSMALEVRESNLPARGLYESRGFRAVSRRARYYRLPVEDALLMRALIARTDRELDRRAGNR